jgi:general secretion pathway protein J
VNVRARGFTLVEVMIAVGITAGMALMTVGSLRQVDRASEIARAQNERYAAARVALSRIAREVSMAFLSDNYDSLRFPRERPTLFVGRDDELLLTTFAHVRLYRDAKESDQALVHYTIEADPDHAGEQALFRREKVRLDDDPERGGRKDLVADRVSALRIQYWDPTRKDWVREWSTRSVEHQKELPPRVRLELEVKLADGRTERFVTEARIELRAPLGTS